MAKMKDQMNESGPQHNLLDGNEDKSMPKAVTKKAGLNYPNPRQISVEIEKAMGCSPRTTHLRCK